jgi:hypothetical protein
VYLNIISDGQESHLHSICCSPSRFVHSSPVSVAHERSTLRIQSKALGCVLGEKEGVLVGIIVGVNEGKSDGKTVGVDVGEPVGDALGTEVGKIDGNAVGDAVGKLVGAILGLEVGELEGIKLGVKVGEEVGTLLGVILGVEVGTGLGISLGEGLGNGVPILTSNDNVDVSGHSIALPLTPLALLIALYLISEHSKISTLCETGTVSCGANVIASGRAIRVSPFRMMSNSVNVASPRPPLSTVAVYVTLVKQLCEVDSPSQVYPAKSKAPIESNNFVLVHDD